MTINVYADKENAPPPSAIVGAAVKSLQEDAAKGAPRRSSRLNALQPSKRFTNKDPNNPLVQRQKRRLQSLFSISKLGGASRAVRKDDEEEEDVDYDSTTEMSPPKPDSKRSKTPAQKANADDPASSTGSLNRKATIAGTPFNKRETDVRKAKPTPSAQTPSTVKQEAASKESSSLPPTTPAPSSSSSSSSTDTKNATLLSPADSVASDGGESVNSFRSTGSLSSHISLTSDSSADSTSASTQSRLARLSALARRNNALSPSRTPAVPPATPSGNTTDKLLHNLHSSANHISHVPSTPASSSASGVFQTPAPKSTPAAKVVSATFSSSSSMANRSALRQKYASPSLRSLTAFGDDDQDSEPKAPTNPIKAHPPSSRASTTKLANSDHTSTPATPLAYPAITPAPNNRIAASVMPKSEPFTRRSSDPQPRQQATPATAPATYSNTPAVHAMTPDTQQTPSKALDQSVAVSTPSSFINGATTPAQPTPSQPQQAQPAPKQSGAQFQPLMHPPAPKTKPSSGAVGKQKLNGNKEVFMVNGKPFYILEVIGSGGSSKVYKVLSKDKKIYALKRIKLGAQEKGHMANYRNEIALLRRLSGNPNVIELIDAQEDAKNNTIYMVFESGQCDLGQYLQKYRADMDENSIRYYWKQILECTQVCHNEHVIHLDLKPPNFVFVNGFLKIIDFGIAKEFGSDTTNIVRESQIGTLNYMSPESIMENHGGGGQFKLSRSSDVWSLGCILYQMVYGTCPFSHLNMIQKFRCIPDPNHKINFPDCGDDALLDVLKQCLNRDAKKRPTIAQLLQHPYLFPAKRANAKEKAAEVAMSLVQLQDLLKQCGVTDPAVAQGVADQLKAKQPIDLYIAAKMK